MKTRIIFLLIIFLICSCGTRKRVMQKTVTEIETSEKKDVKKEEVIITVSNTDIKTAEDNTTYTPVDNTKPMEVEGKKYYNVVIQKKKKTQTDSSKTVKKENRIEEDKTETDIKKKELKKDVAVDRDNSFSFWDWFWLLLAIAIVWLLYSNRFKILKLFKHTF
ncbi:hypothetical protein [Aquimarina intermedia]|uniref:Lipoprotein n=1 Tax=Aquimarina intermedia TaxID=350814 RepID=A0A5S5BWC1_9FLAO|nr:hypothetical protein [Aquimarina intermedia]TYP71475.1 hypothetical protein BD809_10957 [Aquimarina intermedia]